jgi:hypothetical protein
VGLSAVDADASLRSAAPPVFADRFVFVGFPGGKLVALALQNGAPVWEGPVASPKGATELDRVADIVSVPVIDGRQICAVAFQGGSPVSTWGRAARCFGRVTFRRRPGWRSDDRYLFVTDERGAVHALDRTSGISLWKQDKLLNRRVSGPAVQGRVVAVAMPRESSISCHATTAASWRARKPTARRSARRSRRWVRASWCRPAAAASARSRRDETDPRSVGRPNVGKSTLFNRLTRSRDALVADLPGLTRDRHYGHGKLGSKPYLVVDTGGFEPLVKDGIVHEMARQTEQAIAEADAVIFVVDGRSGVTPHRQGNRQQAAPPRGGRCLLRSTRRKA